MPFNGPKGVRPHPQLLHNNIPMKNEIAAILFTLLLMPVFAADVSLQWDANTEPDLAGYKLHYGTVSGSPIFSTDVGKVTNGLVKEMTPGVTYFITATAYNDSGLESLPSNEVVYTVPPTTVVLAWSKPLKKFVWTDSTPAPVPPNTANTYLFERADATGAFSISEMVLTKDHVFPVGLATGTYTFRITAVDQWGARLTPSNTVSMSVPKPPKNVRR